MSEYSNTTLAQLGSTQLSSTLLSLAQLGSTQLNLLNLAQLGSTQIIKKTQIFLLASFMVPSCFVWLSGIHPNIYLVICRLIYLVLWCHPIWLSRFIKLSDGNLQCKFIRTFDLVNILPLILFNDDSDYLSNCCWVAKHFAIYRDESRWLYALQIFVTRACHKNLAHFLSKQ